MMCIMTKKYTIRLASVASLALLFTALSSSASILLSSGDFTILGGTAITSTGVTGTVITNGNVGLSPGATTGITGFPPAIVTKGAIIATGPVTRQARLDLIKVRVGLAGMPSDKNMSNVDLGGLSEELPRVLTPNELEILIGDQSQVSSAWNSIPVII